MNAHQLTEALRPFFPAVQHVIALGDHAAKVGKFYLFPSTEKEGFIRVLAQYGDDPAAFMFCEPFNDTVRLLAQNLHIPYVHMWERVGRIHDRHIVCYKWMDVYNALKAKNLGPCPKAIGVRDENGTMLTRNLDNGQLSRREITYIRDKCCRVTECTELFIWD
jgi:hypothetical protein